MRFAEVAAAVEGIPFMTSWQGRRVYDHLRRAGARDVLELGTAHGASAAYMAAAVAANGGGRVVTVDRYRFEGPAPEETLARAGLGDVVELVRIPHSSYVWWLKEEVERGALDAFDFCYLDGQHDFTVDGMAVLLVERVLRAGGWLLLDDLDWTYEAGTVPGAERLSDAERRAPQVRAVFDLVVREHPSFTDTREEDGTWGWARKQPGSARRHHVAVTRSERTILQQRLRMALRRLSRSC